MYVHFHGTKRTWKTVPLILILVRRILVTENNNKTYTHTHKNPSPHNCTHVHTICLPWAQHFLSMKGSKSIKTRQLVTISHRQRRRQNLCEVIQSRCSILSPFISHRLSVHTKQVVRIRWLYGRHDTLHSSSLAVSRSGPAPLHWLLKQVNSCVQQRWSSCAGGCVCCFCFGHPLVGGYWSATGC